MSEPVTIVVRRNGPFRIEADQAARIRLIDHDGNEIVPTPGKPISLCRCGASAKKPFCDSSHKHIGFCAPEDPASTTDAAAVAPAAGAPSTTMPATGAPAAPAAGVPGEPPAANAT